MTAVFADTYYWLALINPRDKAHLQATELAQTFNRPLVTTTWVLAEVGDVMRKPANRPAFLQLLKDIEQDSDTTVPPVTQSQFDQGVSLFAIRPDKEWSLTDCISIEVMKLHGVREVLTADHHFSQAGLTILMV